MKDLTNDGSHPLDGATALNQQHCALIALGDSKPFTKQGFIQLTKGLFE